MNQPLPAFEVEKLPGTVEHKKFTYEVVYLKDEEGNFVTDEHGRKVIQSKQRTERIVEIDAGWMVYFPRGHSVHITDPEEMVRLGFFDRAELVDINSESEDDRIPQPSETSLKTRIDRTVQRPSRRRSASTGSKTAEVDGT